MDEVDLSKRFAHHPPSGPSIVMAHTDIRNECLKMAFFFNNILPEGREKSLVMTSLEEVMFWANASIARNQKVGN